MTQTGYKLEMMRGDSVFALRSEWDKLWEACPDATEAQSCHWQQLYRKHVAPSEELLSAAARDGRGDLIALGVFSIRRERQTLLRRFGFFGEHDADYHGVLHREGTPEQTGRELLEAALKTAGSVSAAEFLNVPEHSWTRRALELNGGQFVGFSGPERTRLSECYAIPLPATMEEYWAMFSKKTRDRLKGKMRKFGREFTVEFRSITEDVSLPDTLNEIEAVEKARWGAANKFCDKASSEFLRSMITELVRERRCRIFTLHVNGRCVSYIVGFIMRGSLHIPYLAHDISLPGNHSVGLISPK